MGEEQIDRLREDTFNAIDKTRADIGIKLDKVYSRVFETNGNTAIITEIEDLREGVKRAEVRAGDALIKANENKKFCEEECLINTISEKWKELKFTGKFVGITSIIFLLLLFGVSAWNGWAIHKQMLQVAQEYKELKTILTTP